MEKERKYLQLTAAEYLIRVNEIRYDDTQIPNQKIYHLTLIRYVFPILGERRASTCCNRCSSTTRRNTSEDFIVTRLLLLQHASARLPESTKNKKSYEMSPPPNKEEHYTCSEYTVHPSRNGRGKRLAWRIPLPRLVFSPPSWKRVQFCTHTSSSRFANTMDLGEGDLKVREPSLDRSSPFLCGSFQDSNTLYATPVALLKP